MTVQSQAPEGLSTTAEIDPWALLAGAQSATQACEAWLLVLCQGLVPARAGTVLLAQADGSFAPVAGLPAGRDLSYLADIATDALRQREGVVRQDELGHARLAYPLQAGEQLHGAVVLDLGPATPAALEQALRLTHWGAGWLVELVQRAGQAGQPRGAQLTDTLLATLSELGLREAALALVNRLATQFDASQVSLALPRRNTLRMLAMSHSAWFEERAERLHALVQAMHEAYDQRLRIEWPQAVASGACVHAAHRRYAEQQQVGALCTLPLAGPTEVVGVLTLERQRPFADEELAYLDTLAAALAPALALRRDAELSLPAHAARSARHALARLTDSSHPAWKLGAVSLVLALVVLALVPAPFRVSAHAVVEGAVQRSAVAPFEGYLREAPARPGDTVRRGQVLAVLDDKDLRLERVRWESELEVAQRKEREAMAKGNRVDQRLAAAQANQARAQLDLVLARLERVQVTAPFDAVVVKGDLSQLLGSPLEQGKVLFELAPLDAWRVVLKVDERDIGHVATGAAGELVLTSLPGRGWPFTVSKLTPVSVAEGGRNHFRVEAQLQGDAPKLSPNMEGVAKVDAGQRSLLWVWARPLVDWARLAWWKLMP